MDGIELISYSVVINGVEDETRVPINDANASVPMRYVDDLTGEILIFCKYFVFSNFSSKYLSTLLSPYVLLYWITCG